MKLPALIILSVILSLPAQIFAQGYPWCSSLDQVSAEVEGSNLILHHDAATYNCCPDSFSYSVTITANVLYVVETEILSNPCACECCYNLSTMIEDLPPGDLSVVFRWFDDDPAGWRDWPLSVMIGDLGQGGSVHAGSSTRSGCLEEVGVSHVQWGVLKSRYR
jgi:hypothetical protein